MEVNGIRMSISCISDVEKVFFGGGGGYEGFSLDLTNPITV
jgi:hypothetical protein